MTERRPDLAALIAEGQRKAAERERINDLMQRPDSDFIVRPRRFPLWAWSVLAWLLERCRGLDE